MAIKKVCANCKFYYDASCSHFWIDRPEQQTCDDFRQLNPVFEIFCMMNKLGEYKKEDAEPDGKELTDMTVNQALKALQEIIRQRAEVAEGIAVRKARGGQFATLSYLQGKAEAFREVLFWLQGFSSEDEDKPP